MRGAIRLIRLFGIPVQVHWSFFLLFVWVAYIGWSSGLGLYSAGWLALFMVALFVCVVMHEFGHALMARRFGIRTHDITLLPIGGVARLDRIPEQPGQELLVAIAGPLVNVVVAAALWGWLSWQRGLWVSDALMTLVHPSGALFLYSRNFLPALAFTNLFVAAFNMLPAFPLDGGRVTRALLSLWWPRVTATRIAAYLGQGIALLLLLLAFLNFDLILGLIAVFVFTTASREYRYVRDSQMLTSVPVHHVMRRRYTLLAPSDPVGLALRLMTRNGEQGFLLLDELGRPSMAVDEETLLAHVMEGKPEQTPVGELAKRVPAPLAATMPLSDAIRQMEQHQLELMPVMEAGTMVGVLDLQRARKLGRLYART